ncbi:MAG: sugar transferase [Pirellulaceae bacterium]|nr:sugar transferase [Planctomycetales bacterium]
MLSQWNRFVKRTFDVVAAALGLVCTGWLILLAAVVARWDTGLSGFFRQTRLGLHGRPFQILKIRTMRNIDGLTTTVTTARDPRITRIGCFFRRTKIDELPQLINVLVGDMSFVGPRPDVPELMEGLSGDDRVVLSVRPGITGPASIKYRNEEELLAQQANPDQYNRMILFPDKTRINRRYVEDYSLLRDLIYIWDTVAGQRSARSDELEGQPRPDVTRRAA